MEPLLLLPALQTRIEIVFFPPGPGLILAAIIVVFLLIVSAMISGSEVAFFTLSPLDKKSLVDRGTRRSRMVMEFLKTPERLLGTILITNNFVNVGIVIISSFIMNQSFSFGASKELEFLIQVVLVTFFLLLFGEILPKLYANIHPIRFCLNMTYPLKVFEKIFHPLSSFLIFSTSIVNKRLASKKQSISIDDLSDALELTANEISEEKNILEGIVRFGNIDVKEIMKSRMDIKAVEIHNKLDELIRIAIDSGYSRIPIFNKSLDNIKGILYVKDLLPHLNKSNNFNWQTLIRPGYYVPENKKIDDLLNEFQINKIHMALVVDEYGGTSGIVTLEDIIEEIVGEITDESDEQELFFSQMDQDNWQFDGRILLNDFFKITNLKDDLFDNIKGDADTLAGLILEIKGEIPAKNETIQYDNLNFIIESADKRRIKQIRLIVGPKKEKSSKHKRKSG